MDQSLHLLSLYIIIKGGTGIFILSTFSRGKSIFLSKDIVGWIYNIIILNMVKPKFSCEIPPNRFPLSNLVRQK